MGVRSSGFGFPSLGLELGQRLASGVEGAVEAAELAGEFGEEAEARVFEQTGGGGIAGRHVAE